MPAAPQYDDYIYARISEDDIGIEKNVTRQLRNSRGRSAADGGRILGEFYDNDISALNMAPRPGFDQLMAAVTAPNPERRQRRIVCQHTSRIWRNRVERAYGIDSLGKAKVIIVPIDGPVLDLRSAAGRMVAGMIGETDTGESETKGERIRDAARERAQEGRTHAGVLYGWQRTYEHDTRGKVVGFHDTVHPIEAPIVQEIVKRLLAGESLMAITQNLNDRGLPAPRAGMQRKVRAVHQDEVGSRWGRSTVKKLALRPANIGMRIYHRGQDDEELLPAAWPAIVDRADHDRVVSLLGAPGRGRVERPGARQYLLTYGIGWCGVCGAHLRSTRHAKRKLLYACSGPGCVGRSMDDVDGVVTAVMVKLLSRDDALDLLDDHSGLLADALRTVSHLRLRLQQAAGQYADGGIDTDQLQLISSRLKPQISAAEQAAADLRQSPFTAAAMSVVGPGAAERWEAMSMSQRRAVLNAFRVRVVIDRALTKGAKFDPRTVRVLPRGSAGAERTG